MFRWRADEQTHWTAISVGLNSYQSSHFPNKWHIRNPQGCGKRVQATDRVSIDKFLLGIQRVFEASVLPSSTSGTVLGRDKSSPAPAPSQAHSWGHQGLTTPGHFLFKHEFIKTICWNENWPHCRSEEPNFYGFVSIKELQTKAPRTLIQLWEQRKYPVSVGNVECQNQPHNRKWPGENMSSQMTDNGIF